MTSETLSKIKKCEVKIIEEKTHTILYEYVSNGTQKRILKSEIADTCKKIAARNNLDIWSNYRMAFCNTVQKRYESKKHIIDEQIAVISVFENLIEDGYINNFKKHK